MTDFSPGYLHGEKWEPASDPEVRRQGIGSSDAACIMATSPWKTEYELWLEKTGKHVPEKEDKPQFWVGNLLEWPVLERWEFVTGRPVLYGEDMGKWHGTLKHKGCDYIQCHLDGISPEGGHAKIEEWGEKGTPTIVEAKTSLSPFQMKSWGEPGTDEVPAYIWWQCQHQMLTTDLHNVEVAALRTGPQFGIYPIVRDEDAMDAMMDAYDRFWRCVERDEPPTSPDFTTEANVRAAYAEQNDEVELVADDEQEQLGKRLVHLNETLKEMKTQRTKLRIRLMSEMGEAVAMKGGGWSATWKQRKGIRKVDWEAAYRELAEQHMSAHDLGKFADKHIIEKAGPRVFTVRGRRK